MTAAPGTLDGSLRWLYGKGLRYATVFDIGCADGHFFLQHYWDGEFAGALGVNIDPNPIYEPSLRAIVEAIGGHYLIAAAGERDGESEMTLGVHPYWGSLRPEGDLYWQQLNGLAQGKARVPMVSVDSLVLRFKLRPPFLLKLDVQGAEMAVLRGARQTLEHTEIIICEVGLEDFPSLDALLSEAKFALFDMTELRRTADQSLGWFYPVYLNRRHDSLRPKSFWDARLNSIAVQHQEQRRRNVQAYIAETLAKLKPTRR